MRARPTVDGDLTAKYLTSFEKYVDKSAGMFGCWLWRGEINSNGYGRISIHNRGQRVRKQAHRFYYEAVNGPLAADIQLDHLCNTRNCVNPAHLEPVTNRENSLRGVSPAIRIHHSGKCGRGHERETYGVQLVNGRWACKACWRLRDDLSRARKSAQMTPRPSAATNRHGESVKQRGGDVIED